MPAAARTIYAYANAARTIYAYANVLWARLCLCRKLKSGPIALCAQDRSCHAAGHISRQVTGDAHHQQQELSSPRG